MDSMFLCGGCRLQRPESAKSNAEERGFLGGIFLCKSCESLSEKRRSKDHAHSEKLSKSEAIQAGNPYYWTGKKCNKGHESFRYVVGGSCVSCEKIRSAKKGCEALPAGMNTLKRSSAQEAVELRRMERELNGYDL